MDDITAANTTITFHDLPNSAFTLITIHTISLDGSENIIPFPILKPLADTYRTTPKVTLIAYFVRQLADTVL